MPDIKYNVTLSTGEKVTLDENQFNERQEKLFKADPNASAIRVSSYIQDDDDQNNYDQYRVRLQDGSEITLNNQQFQERKDKILASPDVQVIKASDMSARYWGKSRDEARAALDTFNQEHGQFMRDFERNKELADYLDTEGVETSGMHDYVKQNEAQYEPLRLQREQLRKDYFTNPLTKREYEGMAYAAKQLSDQYRSKIAEASDGYERRDWRRAAKMMDDMRKIYEAPSNYNADVDGENGFLDYLDAYKKGAVDKFTDRDFLTRGISAISRNIDIRGISKKLQDEKEKLGRELVESDMDKILSPSEKAEIVAFAQLGMAQKERADDMMGAYNSGLTFADSLGFMAEFILSQGLANVAGKAIATKSTGEFGKWLGRQLMSNQAINRLTSKGVLEAPKAVSAARQVLDATVFKPLIQGLWHTGTQLSSYANMSDMLTQVDDNGNLISAWRAFGNGLLDSIVENYSESFGQAIDLGMDKLFSAMGYGRDAVLGKGGIGRFARWMFDSKPSQIFKEAGFNGMLSEMLEEWVGNAARVGLGIMSGDEFKDFASFKQQAEMAASFAPLSLFGLGSSTMAAVRNSKRNKELAGEIMGIMRGNGFSDEQINDVFNTKFDTASDIADKLAPVLQKLHAKGESAEEDYKKVLNFAGALSQDAVANEYKRLEDEAARNQMQEEIQNISGQFWTESQADGEAPKRSVNVITYADGSQKFILGNVDGTIQTVDRNGKHGFMSQEELDKQVSDGLVTSVQESSLDEYIDGEVQKVKTENEAKRMSEERQNILNTLKKAFPAGQAVTVGTAEEQIPMVVAQQNENGLVLVDDIQKPTQTREISWAEAASLVGIPFNVKTDAQLEQDKADQYDAAEKRKEDYNNTLAPGTEITVDMELDGENKTPVKFKFNKAVTEEGQVILYVTDEDGNETTITEDQAKTEGDLDLVMEGSEFVEPVQQEENEEHKEEQTVDIVSKYTDQTTGEVDETGLWNEYPEDWCRWNDSQRNDNGADSIEYVNGAIKRLQGQQNKLITARQNEADFKKRKELESAIQEKGDRITRLQAIVADYANKEAQAKLAAEVQERRVEREMNEPQRLEHFVAQFIFGQPKGSLNREDWQRETGKNDEEMSKFFAYWAKEGTGKTVKQLAEEIAEHDDMGFVPMDKNADQKDSALVRSVIIDLMRRATVPSDLGNMTRNENESAAKQEAEYYGNAQEAPVAETPEEEAEPVVEEAPVAEEVVEENPVQQAVAEAREEVDTNPTDAQKEAGNYKKGHVTIDGYDITIENPKGSVRSGKDASGKEWSQTMNNDYGYIRMTEGVDGDHIDVFLSDNPAEGKVFVIDQIDPKTGKFDEHKVMYGFNSAEEAQAAYLSNYEEGWQGMGVITEVSKEEFKKWVDSSHRKTKPFSEYKSVKADGAQNAGQQESAEPVQGTIDFTEEQEQTADKVEAFIEGKTPEEVAAERKAAAEVKEGVKEESKEEVKDEAKEEVKEEKSDEEKAKEAASKKVKKAQDDSKKLMEAYKSGNKDAIKKAEKAVADYINQSSSATLLMATANTYKNRRRAEKKDSPAYKMYDFIVKTSEKRLKALGKLNAAQEAQKTYSNRFNASKEELESAIAFYESEFEQLTKEIPGQGKGLESMINGLKMELQKFEKAEEEADESRKDELERQKPFQERIAKWKSLLGDIFDVLTGDEGIDNKEASDAIANGETVRGWYETGKNKAVLHLPHIKDLAELDRTILHEVLSHKGLRALFQKAEDLNKFLDKVWEGMSKKAKDEMLDYVGTKFKTEADRQRAAADEYVAHVAQNNTSVIKDIDETAWTRIVDALKRFIEDMMGEDIWTENDSFGDILRGAITIFAQNEMKRREADARDMMQKQGDLLAEVEGENTPAVATAQTANNPQVPISRSQEKYEDFGNKIGEARKDTALPTGKKKDGDNRPAWAKKYSTSNVKMLSEDEQRLMSRLGSSRNFQEVINDITKGTDYSQPFVGFWDEEIKSAFGKRTRRHYITDANRRPIIFTSKEQFEAVMPVFEAMSQKYRVIERNGKAIIVRPASNGKMVEYAVFDTKEQAVAYLATPEGATELLNRKRENYELPALTSLTRNGMPDYRGGKNITPDDILKTFGFYGGEFGNWLNADERQQFLNLAYDSLMDLASAIGVTPRALSLGGALSIAFGARGRGGDGAAAHYEPGRVVINLTKLKGAGSLAHEWAHALDNYFGMMAAKKTIERGDAEHNREYLSTAGYYAPGVRKEIKDAMNKLMTALTRKEVTREIAVDKAQEQYDGMIDYARRQLGPKHYREDFVNGIRKYQYNRKTKEREVVHIKPTEEQIAKYDELCEKLLNDPTFGFYWETTKQGFRAKGDVAQQLYDLVKEVMPNRAGAYGPLHNAFYYLDKAQPLKERLEKAKKGEKETVTVETTFYEDSKWFDRDRAGAYWTKDVELFARAFEAVVAEKMKREGKSSDYLTYLKGPLYQQAWEHNPYPAGEEMDTAIKAFDKFFDTIQEKEDENGNAILFSRDNENLFDEKNPEVGRFVTSDGESVNFQSEGELPAGPEIDCYVERQFRKNGSFSFTGKDKIQTAADVAYIFKELETAAVENSFLVFVKDGVPTIVHTGIGNIHSVGVDKAPLIVGVKEFAPDEIYMVHNHPSGKVEASRADVSELDVIQRMAGKIPCYGVIIDTMSGEYGYFGKDFGTTLIDNRPGSEKNEVSLEVKSFDRLVFSSDYNAELGGKKSIVNAEGIAAYISSHRLGDRSKVAALLLNRRQNVVGNLVFNEGSLTLENAEDLARQAAENAVRFTAEKVVLFGDFDLDTHALIRFRAFMSNYAGNDVSLMDVVRVEGNHTLSAAEGTLEDASGEAVRFSKVTDQKLIDELEAGEKEIGYRTVVLNPDGSMSSPMAGQLGEAKKGKEGKTASTSTFNFGEWEQAEENPDIADENGKIKLIKTDNASRGLTNVDNVDYNPYIHLRLDTINRQFKDAWKRPDLVYIKSEVPASEVHSENPYHAEKAVKPVGVHPWNGGDLMLSRYDKPVKWSKDSSYVPWDVVADSWAADEKFKKDGVKFDIVPPQILSMLQERGIEILPPSAGKEKEEAYKAWKAGDMAAYENWRDNGETRFSKAPNGKESNLTEEQYKMVRTPQFKKWFGDWEKIARYYPVRKYGSVDDAFGFVTTLFNLPLTNNRFNFSATITKNKSGKLKSGKAITKSINERLHTLALANIDYLFENAEIDVTHPDTKGTKEIEKIHRMGTILWDEETKDFVPVKITAFEYKTSDGNKIYTIEAVDIEKEKTAGQLEDGSGSDPHSPIAVFETKIEKLLEKTRGEYKKVSKVVDENGEPLVMYHGTRYGGFNSFDAGNEKYPRGVYFTKSEKVAKEYAEYDDPEYDESELDRKVYPVFLNLKNPILFNGDGEMISEVDEEFRIPSIREINDYSDSAINIVKSGHDGALAKEGFDEMAVALYSNQIKSAEPVTYDDNGNEISIEDRFTDSADIRFSRDMAKQKQADVEYPEGDELLNETRFSLSKNNRNTIDAWMRKRNDISQETKDAVVRYLDTLNNPTLQLATAKWFCQGVVRLPEDMPKIEQAVSVAGKAKVDPLQYDSPMQLIERHANISATEKRINPDDVDTLHKIQEFPEQGIVVYQVDDSDESRENMRKIINTHFGKEASPWCLLQGDGEGNLTPQSKRYWQYYDAYPKKVAFKDGKLLAFCANSSDAETWWDRNDEPNDGIPVTMKIEGDELGRSGTYNYFSDGRVAGPENVFKGNQQNGVFERWYDNGQQASRKHYKDGKVEGLCERWWYNGQLRRRWNEVNGEPDGLLEEWHSNGNMKERTNYKNGVRVGLSEGWWGEGNPRWSGEFNESGLQEGEHKLWHDNGQLSALNHYKNGKFVGEQTSWHLNGNLRENLTYNDKGEADGLCQNWWGNGALARRTTFVNGKQNGLCEEWYENGNLSARRTYKNDLLVGKEEEFYVPGSPETVSYRNDRGAKDGEETVFNLDGTVFKKIYWNDGHREADETYYKNGNKKEKIAYEADGSVLYVLEWEEDGTPRTGSTLFSKDNANQEIFVSNAEQAVKGIPMDKATPQQWVKMIEGRGGLKAGEDKWIGLSDWLKSQDKKTITKQEVLDYIDENKIRIEETRYSEVDDLSEDFIKKYPEFNHAYYIDIDDFHGTPYIDGINSLDAAIKLYNDHHDDKIIASDDYENPQERITDEGYDKLLNYGGELLDEARKNDINSTRLHYTTNGLENKREIALTVPTIEPWGESDLIHFGDAGGGRAIAWARFGETKAAADQSVVDEVKGRHTSADESFNKLVRELKEKYNVSLYGDLLNVVSKEERAELRRLGDESGETLNELESVVSKGNGKVLFIDEIQSKRHQEARENGYKDEAKIAESSAVVKQMMKDYGTSIHGLEDEIKNAKRDAVAKIQSLYHSFQTRFPNGWTKEEEIEQNGFQNIRLVPDPAIVGEDDADWYVRQSKKRDKASEDLDKLNKWKRSVKGVPAAPFEKNWQELTMKRMLRLAAEEGYDYMAWTTGEQQAERYNIGNLVDSIGYSDTFTAPSEVAPSRNFLIRLKNGTEIPGRVFTEGEYKGIIQETFENSYGGKPLSDVVGKAIANEIVDAKEEGELKGEGLRIGASGMMGFYDKMLPEFMNKYGKKWGVKVEDINLPELENGGITAHAVRITPEMKESVMAGQTMFSKIVDSVDDKGLSGVIGKENTTDYYNNLYKGLSGEIRDEVISRAEKDGWNLHNGLRQYLSDVAAKGYENDETGILRLAGLLLNDYMEEPLDEKTLRYVLWRAGQPNDMLTDIQAENNKRRWGIGEDDTRFSKGDLATSLETKSNDAKQKIDNAEDAKEINSKALRGSLLTAARAMAIQKDYDKYTIETLSNLAKELLKDNTIDALNRREIARILGVIRTSVGKAPRIVKNNADALIGIIVDHLLAREVSAYKSLIRSTGTKVNQTGVEVQGNLDVRGQNVLKAYKAALDMETGKEDDDETVNSIYGRLQVLSERMENEDDAIRKEAEDEYEGLQLALEYKQSIKDSIDEAKSLADQKKEAEERKKDGKMTSTAYNEYVRDNNQAILENKIERIEAYRDFRSKLQARLDTSSEAHKEFVEREKARREEIQHYANYDMQGVSASPFKNETWMDRFVNSSVMRFLTSPLSTFDQMLRLIGRKSVNGQGYLWNHLMNKWRESTENTYNGVKDAEKILNDKVSEVFGKPMHWSDLYDVERDMPKAKVTWFDDGEMKEHELSQGNLLYIYMVNKMADGRMKLRRMGITEEDVKAIEKQMDERFLRLADWIQDEFLVDRRNKYNEVHERLFGASMAAIDNYFPLKINKRSLNRKEDIGTPDNDDTLPSTTTGSIIKRRRNSQDLDLLNADAFSVVIDHINEMEQWAAFAEFNHDLNMLLSYKKFRNRLQNMTTVYGSGKQLWSAFRNVSRIAGGTYHPAVKRESLDAAAVNIAKGVTGAKIAFRAYTAMKQLLSMPAFVSDANILKLGENLIQPWKAWNWAMENLPMLEKRWKSRISGETRLMETDSDWKLFQNKMYKALAKYGMTPNAFIDAVTISIGARAMYQTKYDQYIKEGYTEEQADKKAKHDATVLYNETQQSNEGAFVSPVQLDRTVYATMFTVFRNASMGYQRQLHDALRNLGKMMNKNYRDESIAFMKKQMMREGLTEEQAEHASVRRYEREKIHSAVRVGTFGFLVQFAWNLGSSLMYLLFGDDDDKKKAMLVDAARHAALGGFVEGLAGGNVISDALDMVAKGENLRNYDPSLLPIASDIKRTYQMWGYDKVAAVNEIINLAVQAGVGVNPQTLTDAVVAVIDACGGDLETSKEAMLLFMRVMQVPQSQLDDLYIDELGVDGRKASKMKVKQMAERYAKYKVAKGAALTGWAYSDEAEEKREKAFIKKFNSKVKERNN